MNKSLFTNVVSASIFAVGLIAPTFGLPSDWSKLLQLTGLFALSGGVTNWLAVHMLFEKIPFIYGSGVIPSRFEDFKLGIKELIVNEFFTREQIDRFLAEAGSSRIEDLATKADFDRVFLGLVEAIEESSMGGMLKMLGGREALEPLREPMVEKLKGILAEIVDEDSGESGASEQLIGQIEAIIERRLDELTPRKVKDIVENMIRKHLGWLVVWGGVFGGLIGLLVGVLERL
ncbi:MAG: DUF445 domain-containing protein [Thiotrichales bacterium]|nr:DUF445 domain-containing protein [Thiotrichales bacterium]OUX52952.1 MAG: DUF445 domain-containing protein [Methylococcaceae bacterium TMED282]